MTRMASDRAVRYGDQHRLRRRQLAAFVATGTATCSRCGGRIATGESWDLGHLDGGGPLEYSGPEHRRCNSAAPYERLKESVRRTSRDW
jgi:hypothetical protein